MKSFVFVCGMTIKAFRWHLTVFFLSNTNYCLPQTQLHFQLWKGQLNAIVNVDMRRLVRVKVTLRGMVSRIIICDLWVQKWWKSGCVTQHGEDMIVT